MPTLINKSPPPSFSRRKFIDPVRTKRTQNADLEPTELTVIKLNKTLPRGVSVKPQVELYKTLNPAIVPDVPASYIQQPDRDFQAMLAESDMFNKYQTTQREAEVSVGFFLDQELKREMAETNLDPYMYSRKQQRLDNEINRLIAQPNRRLTPQEIFALENRILGGDPRLLPDYASLSYIVRHSALLDFIRDRKVFENMTAWKTSFMNVLNNTFARLRVSKPEWFNKVLAENGRKIDQTMTTQPGHPGTTGVTFPPVEPSGPARTSTRRPDGEREIVHAPPTVPVPPAMEVPVRAPTAPAQEAKPQVQPVFSVASEGPPEPVSVSAAGPPDPDAPGVSAQFGVDRTIRSAEESAQRLISDMFSPTSGAAEVVSSRPTDIVLNDYSNRILRAIGSDRTSTTDKKLMDLADMAKSNEVESDTIRRAAIDIGRFNVPTPDIFDAIAYIKVLYQEILVILTREGGHLYDVRNVLTNLDKYESKKKKP